MATIKVFKNGTEVMMGDSKEKTRENLLGLLVTKNVDSQAASEAVKFLGESYGELFLAGGDPSDVYEITENGELKVEYTRSAIAKRIGIAAIVDTFSGKIFTKKGEKTATEAVAQEVAVD